MATIDLQIARELDQITRAQSNLVASIQGGTKFDVNGEGRTVQATDFSNTILSNVIGGKEIQRITQFIMKVTVEKQGLRNKKTSKLSRIREAHTAKALGKDVVNFLTTGDDLEVKINTFVHIAISTMMDAAFLKPADKNIHPDHHDDSLIVEVCRRIGQEIELLAHLHILRETNKDSFNKVFYNTLTDQVLSKDATQSRAIKALEEVDSSWNPWSSEIKVRVGMIFFGCVFSSYSKDDPAPFRTCPIPVNGKTRVWIEPNMDVWSQANDKLQGLLDLAIVKEPMIALPKDWELDSAGGYYTNSELNRETVVRGHIPMSSPSQEVLDFLNNLQHVGYKVNPFTLNVANLCSSLGIKVGKFIPMSNISTRVTKLGNQVKVNPWNIRETRRSELTLKLANKYANEDVWYLPWAFDFRGRSYPIPSFMTPQGTDFDKSLILLETGETLTEEGRWWLYFHLATTYGLDKETLDNRVQWAADNHQLFVDVVTDPIGNLNLWASAEDPWMFLAACKEYVDVVLNGQPSHLMVATDATCSGIQVLSGLSHDKSAATMVNVIPDVVRHDAYGAVATKAMEFIPAEVQHLLADPKNARTIAKHVVMTVPYNASVDTNYDQVFKALTEINRKAKDLGQLEYTFTKDDANKIGAGLIEAMKHVLNGPMAIRDWFNKSITPYVKAGNDLITWVTPSGFTVVQEKYGRETVSIEATLFGNTTKMKVAVGIDTSKVNTQKHATAFAPNLIHSLDSSLLHIAFKDADYSFSVIHDSILTGANHMGQAIGAMKASYAYIFSDEVNYIGYLQEMFGAGDPPVPPVTFDSSVVMDSDYFFS